MRRIFTTIFLLNLCVMNAQNNYTIQKSSQTYTPLTGATLASGTGTWSSFASFPIPIGFTFNYFGTNYTTINCEGSAFCIFDLAFYEHTVHPYTVHMRDA